MRRIGRSFPGSSTHLRTLQRSHAGNWYGCETSNRGIVRIFSKAPYMFLGFFQECEHQFRYQRWNCSKPPDAPIIGPVHKLGKQTKSNPQNIPQKYSLFNPKKIGVSSQERKRLLSLTRFCPPASLTKSDDAVDLDNSAHAAAPKRPNQQTSKRTGRGAVAATTSTTVIDSRATLSTFAKRKRISNEPKATVDP